MKVRKGFTLIELLIVLAIIGVLMSIGIPVYTSQLAKAKARAVAANLKTIAQTLANQVTLGAINESTSLASNTTPKLSYFVKGINENEYAAYIDYSDNGTADIYVAYKGDVATNLIEEELYGCDATNTKEFASDTTYTKNFFNSARIGCAMWNVPSVGF